MQSIHYSVMHGRKFMTLNLHVVLGFFFMVKSGRKILFYTGVSIMSLNCIDPFSVFFLLSMALQFVLELHVFNFFCKFQILGFGDIR